MTAPSICAAPGCPNVRPCPVHTVPEGRSRGWDWSTTIVPRILARDGHRCVMCGRPCPHADNTTTNAGHHHVDHITRRSEGGDDSDGNLRTVCAAFNLRGECG